MMIIDMMIITDESYCLIISTVITDKSYYR